MLPEDVLIDYIYKNDDFILVKDPKHNSVCFHYVIWSTLLIDNILNIDEIFCEKLRKFIINIKTLKLFVNEKMYFTYPPTINRIHLHIVPFDYISYRPLRELYFFKNINGILNNVRLIKNINEDKIKSLKYDLWYEIGVVIMETDENLLDKMNKITKFKKEFNLNFIIMIREKIDDDLIEFMTTNCKLIDLTLFGNNNYELLIKHDAILHV